MKKHRKLLTIFAAFLMSTSLFTGLAAKNSPSVQAASSSSTKSWDYPFTELDKKGVRPMYESQVYGITDYARCLNPLSYFHDGWDFGWGEVGRSTVKAIHPGKVKEVAYGNGLGWFVWVVSPDKYVEIYQEGFNKKKDISVKAGQTVKTGQKIGKLTGSHLHLGLSKTTKKYINQHGYPCGNWYKNNGTWLNPVSTIKKNIKKR